MVWIRLRLCLAMQGRAWYVRVYACVNILACIHRCVCLLQEDQLLQEQHKPVFIIDTSGCVNMCWTECWHEHSCIATCPDDTLFELLDTSFAHRIKTSIGSLCGFRNFEDMWTSNLPSAPTYADIMERGMAVSIRS